MAELIHNYLKGRMNKDLDERLVPNGEYRDALNIEISTSEDSNTGAVQTLKGNAKVTKIDAAYDIIGGTTNIMTDSSSSNATTVGSIAIETEKKVFNFISLASDLEEVASFSINNVVYTKKTGVKSDVIMQWDAYVNQEGGKSYPLVVDVFESRIDPPGVQANAGVIEAVGGNSLPFVQLPASINPPSNNYHPAGVRPGMRVQLMSPDGIDAYAAGDEIIVTKILSSTVIGNTKIFTTLPSDGRLMTQSLIDQGYVYRFTAPRILNFQTGTQESETNVSGTPTSSTPKDTMITAINYVDGILFYTDNRNEPKRIHVKDFYNQVTGSFLSTANIQQHSPFRYTNKINYFKEEHITTIRKSPRLAPSAKGLGYTREPGGQIGSSGETYSPFTTSTVGQTGVGSFNLVDAGGNGTAPLTNLNAIGNTIAITASNEYVNWQVGDTIEFVGNASGASWSGTITEDPNTNVALTPGEFVIEISDYGGSYAAFQESVDANEEVPVEQFVGSLSQNYNYLYNKDFISFAVRYKYINGEYSSISPYSPAVFIPSTYQYSGLEGENRGMLNALSRVVVSNFVTPEVPSDVEHIQILFKNNNSLNLNIVKDIKRQSNEWLAITPGDANVTGKVVFEAEVFGATVESKQLTRIYDTVPRSAKAQEFIASRLMYGNYKEGYDLVDVSASDVEFLANTSVTSYTKTNLTTYEGSNISINNNLVLAASTSIFNEQIYNVDFENLQQVTFSTVNREYDNYGNTNSLIPGVQNFWDGANAGTVPTYAGTFRQSPFLSPSQRAVFDNMNNLAFEDAIYYTAPYKASYTTAQLVTLANYKNNAFSLGSQDGGTAMTMEITGQGTDSRSFSSNLFAVSEADFTTSSPQSYIEDNGNALTATDFSYVHPNNSIFDDSAFSTPPTNGNSNTISGFGLNEIKKPNYYELDNGAHPPQTLTDVASVVTDVFYECPANEDVEVDINTIPVFQIKGQHLTFHNNAVGSGGTFGTQSNKGFIDAKFSSLTVTVTLNLIKTDLAGVQTVVASNSVTETPSIPSTGAILHSINTGNLSLNSQQTLFAGERLHTEINFDYSVSNQGLPDVTDPLSIYDFTLHSGGNIPKGLSSEAGVAFNNDGHAEVGEVRASYYVCKFASQQSSMQINTTNVSNIPSYTVSTRAFPSVKSDREYQVGIVYGDYYGRETPILYDKNSTVRVSKDKSPLYNNLSVTVQNNPPAWADYYKFYIKELGYEYYNVPLYKAFPLDIDEPNTGGAVASATGQVLLAFSSSERSKIEVGDHLVLKKAHGVGGSVSVLNYLSGQPSINSLAGAVVDEAARFRVLEIIDTLVDDTSGGSGFIQTAAGQNVLGADLEDTLGRFFVKIKADPSFDQYIGIEPGTNQTVYSAAGLRANSERGTVASAVFEVEKKKNIDVDLFYEVGNAYPIRLDEISAKDYLHSDFVLQIENISSQQYNPSDINHLNRRLRDLKVKVKSIEGATSFGANHVLNTNPASLDQGCGLAFVEFDVSNFHNALDNPNNVPGVNVNGATVYDQLFNPTLPQKISLIDPVTGGKVQLETVYSLGPNSRTIAVKAFTHKNTFQSTPITITLPFYNCISFGNGVESDRILDLFDEDTMYPYGGAGEKISGFKATLPNPDYKETQQTNQIIFSQQYSKTIGGGFNEFIMEDNITKLLNYEFGYITKLHARNTDLIALCEAKVVKILAQKDAAYDVMGTSTFIASNKILGGIVPFVGNYGCQHAESFAEEEYRIYFVDQAKGAVLRLSRDGLTPISEAGMNDWFNDNLSYAQSVIGGYDAKKNAYIITIHNIISSESTKEVYTLGFKENVKGWTSFKSYISESSVSLSNKYYTFKNGLMWLHHPEELDSLHCNFYGTQYVSSLTDIFNESSNIVKNYKAVSYEGTQSKVDAFTDVVSGGITYNDGEFYNDVAKTGWYVESIVTDKESGEVNEFIEKEGKWHNYIKSNPSSALDFSTLAVQGIDVLSSNAVVTNGSLQAQPFNFSFNIVPTGSLNVQWSTNSTTSNTSTFPATATVTITPTANYAVSAADFTAGTFNITVDGIIQPPNNYALAFPTFTNTTTPGLTSNQVVATVTLDGPLATTLTADTVIEWETPALTTMPIVQAEHVVEFIGNFGNNGETFTLNSHPWHTGTSLTSSSEIVVFSQCNMNQQGLQFLSFTVDGNGIYAYDPNNPPTVTFGPDIINNGELVNYTSNVSINANNEAFNVYISYTPTVTDAPGSDIFNNITIVTNSITPILEFTTPSSAASPIILPSFATTGINELVTTNVGPFTATIVDSGSPNVIIDPPNSLTVNQPPLFANDSITFDVVDSGSTTTDSIASITIQSTNYPALSDTAHFIQPAMGTDYLSAAVEWQPAPNAFPTPVANLVAGTYLADFTGNNFGNVFIDYDNSTGVPPALAQGDVTFIDTGDGTSFVSFDSVSQITNTQARYRFNLTQNTSTATRAFDIQITHPDPNVNMTHTLTVTQDGAPLGNFPFNFEIATAQSLIDGTMTDVAGLVEYDDLGVISPTYSTYNQGQNIYANVNTGSTYSATNNGSNGYYGLSSDPNYNQIGIFVTFPSGQYYENLDWPSFMSNDSNDIVPVSNNQFFTAGTQDYDPFSYQTSGGLPATSTEGLYTVGIPGILPANTWVASDSTDSNLCRIPIDRTATIEGINPLVDVASNPIQAPYGDSFTLVQKGKPVLFLPTSGNDINAGPVPTSISTDGSAPYNFTVYGNFLAPDTIVTKVRYYSSLFNMQNDIGGVDAQGVGVAMAFITNDPEVGGAGFGTMNVPANTTTYSTNLTLQFAQISSSDKYARVDLFHSREYSTHLELTNDLGTSYQYHDSSALDCIEVTLLGTQQAQPILEVDDVNLGEFCHLPGEADPNDHLIGGVIPTISGPTVIPGTTSTFEYPPGTGVFYDTDTVLEFDFFTASISDIYDTGTDSSGNEHFIAIKLFHSGNVLPTVDPLIVYTNDMSNPNVTVTTPTGSMTWVANMANSDIVTPTGTPPHTAEFRFKFDAQRLNALSLDTIDKSIVFTINHGSIGQLKKRIKINLRHDPNTSGAP